MNKNLLIYCVVFFASMSNLAAESDHTFFFRARVVPFAAPGSFESFGSPRETPFEVRLHVTKMLAGDGLIQDGKDYAVSVHSIAMTFGVKSVKEVEGQEFTWYLSVTVLDDGTRVASLYPGKRMYESYRKSHSNSPTKE